MAKILGFLWVFFGIIWLIRPQMLKNRLKRKINRRMKFAIFGALLILGILMIGSVMKAEGFLPKIVGIIGAILIIKGILVLVSKASGKLWAWWAEQSLLFFRIQALIFIVIGIILLKA